MTTSFLNPVELRALGFEALVKSLGWVNAVRFVQQYESSSLNYTEERQSILPDADPAELIRRMEPNDRA
jgi:hypothetical protein